MDSCPEPSIGNCPACGSADWVPIFYGLPAPEGYVAAHLGVVQLGGCTIWADGPSRACRDCKIRWLEESDRAEPDATSRRTPEPIARARAVLDNPPPELLGQFDFGPACVECGGMMRRTGSYYSCGFCGHDARSGP